MFPGIHFWRISDFIAGKALSGINFHSSNFQALLLCKKFLQDKLLESVWNVLVSVKKS